jgi:hypothetical protein
VPVDDDRWETLFGAGIVQRLDGGRVRVPNPGLVRAGAEAVRLGMPPDTLVALYEELSSHVTAVTASFVDLFRRTVWADYVGDGLPQERQQHVRDVVGALQPVAAQALLATFREAMPAAISTFLDEVSDAYEQGAPAEGTGPADSSG